MTQEEAEDITLYHCSACEPAHGPTVVANRRKSLRETKKLNYTNEAAVHEYYWTKILQGKTFGKDDFERLHGDQINLDWARKTGLHRPVVVPSPDGLDMKMPDSRISVSEIADLVGRNTLVECLQVATQSSEVMSLGDWANYFSLKPEKRNRLLNVITLEIGSSRLAERIQRPALVRQLDWVNLTWPKHLVESRESPQVQLYCLMGVANSYTDFHIDFGGSSVFYHILSGEKIFYFVEPTRNNLKSYEHWGSSALQSSTFFPDTLEPGTCKKVKLVAGNTMIIPTGWIHAVFTPVDTIVIGGNFIHGLNISRQLDCVTLENRTDVPLKFRYPFFEETLWYAAKYYLGQMYTDPQSLSRRELYGLLDLSEYLKRQSSMQTDLTNSKKERKKIRRSIPLKNVEFMLSCFAKNIQLLLDKNPIDADDIWMSDLSEMEFLDSDSDAESDIASIPEQIDDDFAISDAIKAEDDEVDYIYEKFQKEQVVCEPYKRKIDVVQQTMKRPHSNAAVSIKPKPTKIMSVFQRLSKSLKKRR